MTSNTLESFVSGLEPLLIALIAVCVLVGCVAAMKILKGDVYHSVPWFPWLVPIISWLAAAACGYLVLF
ncbi:MAG: hypothetical protein L0K12_05295 [Brevibacterium aurantiacum]|uniref:hypothetical protein n=1 Tax=Brachybacterium alimentarium TaxID=47845 RepID=UPI000DF46F9F|nr:hypothetical protein [Brachybacterium alimentarium]MDN6301474.1 hypothetical protein [Brachybacterium sp.]MDN6327862.1 hypothetical protein [Brachybacterium sp.]MDN6372326.1 hypothetical protein [Brevibacterium aurantiacum]RCS68740.1 hypothetical protein CIK68_12380 [Brachybacterium alimentarium]